MCVFCAACQQRVWKHTREREREKASQRERVSCFPPEIKILAKRQPFPSVVVSLLAAPHTRQGPHRHTRTHPSPHPLTPSRPRRRRSAPHPQIGGAGRSGWRPRPPPPPGREPPAWRRGGRPGCPGRRPPSRRGRTRCAIEGNGRERETGGVRKKRGSSPGERRRLSPQPAVSSLSARTLSLSLSLARPTHPWHALFSPPVPPPPPYCPPLPAPFPKAPRAGGLDLRVAQLLHGHHPHPFHGLPEGRVGGGWGGPAAAAGGRRAGVEVVGHPAPFFQAADGADERDDG